jgi:uncharacterized membrane protein (UPF0136 family)
MTDGTPQPQQVRRFWASVWVSGLVLAPILLVTGILLVVAGVSWGLPLLIVGAICTVGFAAGRVVFKRRVS